MRERHDAFSSSDEYVCVCENRHNGRAKYLPLLVALTYADERLFKPVVGCWSFVPGGKMRDKLNIVLNRSVTLMSSFAEHSSTFTLLADAI